MKNEQTDCFVAALLAKTARVVIRASFAKSARCFYVTSTFLEDASLGSA
jgi:hypothetical protein